MSFREKVAPAFDGSMELPGQADEFMTWLQENKFSPTGTTGPRTNYQVRLLAGGLLIEATDLLTVINIGLERVGLAAEDIEPGRFRLTYQVVFPGWAKFGWTISLCTTLIPIGFLTGLVFLGAAFFPGIRDFANHTVLNPWYLVAVLPFILLGLGLPLWLIVQHKPKAREVLERSLRAAADRAIGGKE